TGPQSRQPVLSTTVSSGSTPQTISSTIPHLSMQRERSHQGTPSKPMSHAHILPAEPPRNINETNSTHVQTSPLSQASSHLSNRNSSRPVSDSHPILQPVHQQTPTHRNVTISPTMQHVSSHSSQQRKPNTQTIALNSAKSSSTISKSSHTTSRTSHNKQSHKAVKYTQQEATYQENMEAAQAADAARVLVMSSRQRADQQRSMNSEHNVPNISRFSELTLGTSSINNLESSPRSSRYTGSVIMDYSISASLNDDFITNEQEIGLTPHNRGHKMKNRAAALDSGVKLRAPYGYQEDLEYIDIPNGSRRPVIYRISTEDAEQVTEFDGDLLD
ncbi:17054_t:CDS:1, partial [Racocetra fulgida]